MESWGMEGHFDGFPLWGIEGYLGAREGQDILGQQQLRTEAEVAVLRGQMHIWVWAHGAAESAG